MIAGIIITILVIIYLWNAIRASNAKYAATKAIYNAASSISYSVAADANIDKIAATTDEWIRRVSIDNNPQSAADMFCADGNLVGTVSQHIRTGDDIKGYFDYFAKIPGLEAVDREYNIEKIGEPNIYLNTAFITWIIYGEPVVARMTFIFRDGCIYQLHSSALPDLNERLHEISGIA